MNDSYRYWHENVIIVAINIHHINTIILTIILETSPNDSNAIFRLFRFAWQLMFIGTCNRHDFCPKHVQFG